MAMVTFQVKGKYSKTKKFLEKAEKMDIVNVLAKYGLEGVAALAANTPKESGDTAAAWGYEIDHGPGFARLYWTNSNINQGVNIAIILQYGHGTGTGGWVEGRDYINPAIQPIFDKIAEKAWKEVTD